MVNAIPAPTTVSLRDAMADPAFRARAAQTFEEDLPHHPSRLGDLMWACYQAFPQEATWLDRSILATTNANTAERFEDTTQRAALYFKLATRLRTRFELQDRVGDLTDAVTSYRRALDLTPESHHERTRRLNDLGTSLMERYRRIGELCDLEEAIVAYQRLAEAVPDRHFLKPLALGNYGAALRDRFLRIRSQADLDLAISVYSRAVEMSPDGHPEKPSLLCSLGNSLRTRFEQNEKADVALLERALALHRHATALTRPDNPDRSEWLDGLGVALLTHFEHTGQLASLEEAIVAHRQATELSPPDSNAQRRRLTHLGLSLLRHFERTGELEDIQQAILVQRRAVELTPDDHPDKALCFNNLGISFLRRFERTLDGEDIDNAVETLKRALDGIPDGHPEQPTMDLNLGNAFLLRYERTGVVSDHDRSLPVLKRAVELAREGQPNLIMLYNSLACCLVHQYLRTNDTDLLSDAISIFRKGAEFSTQSDPFLSVSLKNLASAQRLLFESTHDQAHFEAAYQSFMASASLSFGLPTEHMQSAMRCISMLTAYPEFSSTKRLLSAYSRVVGILPEVVWLGHGINRRYDESAKYGEIVSAAVAAAISAGAMEQAVEWLEAGRSVIWSQLLSLRTPLDELRDAQPDLAGALETTRAHLQQSVHTTLALDADAIPSAGGASGLTVNPTADRHRSLVAQYEKLLEKIRRCTGFENFLRPQKVSSLIPAPALMSGPVVFINVHLSRCDAVVITSSGHIKLVPLSELSYIRAKKLCKLWGEHALGGGGHSRAIIRLGDPEWDRNMVKVYLGHMWSWIVKPILSALDLISLSLQGENARLPHVTWCPTGPLMQLPLHAAGLYGEPNRQRVYDCVVSSYTPSLSALKRSYDSLDVTGSLRDVLIVTQPSAPGQTPIPAAAQEGARLADTLDTLGASSKWINEEFATARRVRSVVGRYPWVHFACHGSQNQDNPTSSAFELYDGPLTLSDLMSMMSNDAELAFLSACQTAVGDGKVPEESAHLAAGMLAVGFKGVVATMWSIQDDDAPIIVAAYYKELTTLRTKEMIEMKGTGSAYALHEATRVLREAVDEGSFMRWIPFVHFGV
ncbi:unnamed protein product [Peniophora sp. CBMAI 1063]|nr:unnamed protein product [Peniophora sp. CBMAI 1063]